MFREKIVILAVRLGAILSISRTFMTAGVNDARETRTFLDVMMIGDGFLVAGFHLVRLAPWR